MIYPEINFKPKLQVINTDQITQIHFATLELLERTGVQITNRKALEVLDGAGARVIGNRVRFPAWMVEDAIQKAPSRVVLGRRDGERSVFLEADKYWFGPCIDCVDYLDPFSNKRHRFTSDHCRITATLADALPNYTWVMTIGMADDMPAEVADWVNARQSLQYCEKPLVFCCKDLDSTRDIFEMALLIAGDKKTFFQAPTIVQNLEPISPLTHYDLAIEKLMFCAEMGIPLLYFPAPQAGSTAPATFAATIVQGSAESLSGLVLAQLVRPGIPFIYGAFTTVMDMRTTIFSYGAPEMSLMVAALAQMAQYYRIPFWGTAGCSDAKFPDPQAAAESAFSCILSALSGANLIHDPGWIDHGSVTSPAHMVLVDEILHMVNQFMGGILIGEETLALDVMDRVGPGGHFLYEEHTMNHFREVWYPQIFDRMIHDAWLEQGAKDFEERLQGKTKKMMEHRPNPLPAEIRKELDRMAKHWK